MENFKKPNLNAPRFRPEVRSILEKKFFEEFKIKHSQYKNISDAEIRKMIKEFNRFIYQKIVNSRDGVQLPESIGWLFIGTCQESKKKNIDFAKSKEYGLKVTNPQNSLFFILCLGALFVKNIFANLPSLAQFLFVTCREFKRCVAKVYPENWNMYTVVEPTKKLKQLYNKAVYKEISLNKTKKDLLNYNEFDI